MYEVSIGEMGTNLIFALDTGRHGGAGGRCAVEMYQNWGAECQDFCLYYLSRIALFPFLPNYRRAGNLFL